MGDSATRDLLLLRRGLVFIEGAQKKPLHDLARIVALELAELGYAISDRLRAAMACLPIDELTSLRTWLLAALYRGDAAIASGSECYALFREQLTGTIAASDLLS